MNPWAIVAMVAIGVAGSLGFAVAGKADGGLIMGLITIGIAALGAAQHAESRKEVKQLRASMRPPSLVDEREKNEQP